MRHLIKHVASGILMLQSCLREASPSLSIFEQGQCAEISVIIIPQFALHRSGFLENLIFILSLSI